MPTTRRISTSRKSDGTAPLLLMGRGGLLLAVLAAVSLSAPARAQSIPADAQATCTVPAPTFVGWFETGAPSLNGVVKPADSLNFPNIPNCSFYQWSKQMFLWLTSPAPQRYGGGAHIFDSPSFYDVSPPDKSGNRIFIPHTAGRSRLFHLRATKPGPDMLPVILDKRGRMFDVLLPRLGPSGNPIILNRLGKEVEIGRITLEENKKPIFLDKRGKPIPGAKLMLAKQPNRERKLPLVQKFVIGRRPIFLDLDGNMIDTEEGQADNNVLEAQTGSLVYYAAMVNDVYAYFLTGTKNGGIAPAPTQFPTTAADLNKITAFATAHGKTFPDPNALAVELKTAWVDVAGLPNASSYITMKAMVPTYNTANPNKWTASGQKNVTLALVSMHVVGSALGHPEMLWATFEHFGNAPNAQYDYNSTTGPKTIPQSTAGTWLFCANGSAGPFNQPHMSFDPPTGNILSVPPFTISSSNTLRLMPWGTLANAFSNTEVISIHNSVSSQMPVGDVRNNYFMTGTTWTPFGAPPTGASSVGTNLLANSALETYAQGTNCFSCHLGNMLGDNSGGGLSHIYGRLKPLF